MRIARTTTLFTRLMSTLLEKEETPRRMGFRAIETQLELADALIRQDHAEVQRLVRETLATMGVNEDQLRELARRLSEAGGLDPAVAEELGRAFGLDPADSGGAIDAGGVEDLAADLPDLDPELMQAIHEALEASDDELDEPGAADAPAESEERSAPDDDGAAPMR